jgi:hypothetical protein
MESQSSTYDVETVRLERHAREYGGALLALGVIVRFLTFTSSYLPIFVPLLIIESLLREWRPVLFSSFTPARTRLLQVKAPGTRTPCSGHKSLPWLSPSFSSSSPHGFYSPTLGGRKPRIGWMNGGEKPLLRKRTSSNTSLALLRSCINCSLWLSRSVCLGLRIRQTRCKVRVVPLILRFFRASILRVFVLCRCISKSMMC